MVAYTYSFSYKENIGAQSEADMMWFPTRHSFLTAVSFLLLLLFIAWKLLEQTEHSQNLVITEDQVATSWLTVGISSVSQQNQGNLLNTLASLYRACSPAEKKQLTVLVHLADANFTWLQKTVAHISRLYSSQILAGKLLLIHAPPDAYPTVEGTQNETSQGQFYSKQNTDYAFLMSFARNLSTYFLLIEDNVFCAPNFVTHIYSTVATMKPTSWVLLEFSNMGLLGKLFHSRNLPFLAQFLLLFHKEKPLDRLILHFRTLLIQKTPLLYRPFLFYHRLYSHPTGDKNATSIHENPHGPHVFPAAVYTDMKVFDVHLPWEAYTLDESFFLTYNVSTGNHLTVLLNHPANLRRVQVITGAIVDGKYTLQKGQVELGYSPDEIPQYCANFVLLDYLQQGLMDREILLESLGKQVSCVRVVVNANQAGGLIIRHIYLWKENAR
ncbi:alpha-1,3-mannosyl-glycoprotein 4-beta-N-acetylglucosaminyltransferase-like protein MGAT4E [Perognathus longimembris pacificus]|uniref:alpha-1,3-mannosyl-glycoprotein 4-beta-N-acetylglucosaminyltransferase-like protein MGAT4E n=1 Tax=Perognathus longimembris pacificus TaxID=214514 RepID=UPI002018EA66|nr:alpha-1,3-mannosyl-glycoprotein 4-beta-N-acetylglucosaminyltransferase-like protein MGAT4E [Perognathus longimembris pacificus]